jgi:hypothetical protein
MKISLRKMAGAFTIGVLALANVSAIAWPVNVDINVTVPGV